MVAEARSRGEVTIVHSDQEPGLLAIEGKLLAVGLRLSTTQGHDPQSNGLAEQTAGQLCRMARAALAHYSVTVAAAPWQHAMVWAAQRLVGPKLPPFGAPPAGARAWQASRPCFERDLPARVHAHNWARLRWCAGWHHSTVRRGSAHDPGGARARRQVGLPQRNQGRGRPPRQARGRSRGRRWLRGVDKRA